jgi:hypothetical protein
VVFHSFASGSIISPRRGEEQDDTGTRRTTSRRIRSDAGPVGEPIVKPETTNDATRGGTQPPLAQSRRTGST